MAADSQDNIGFYYNINIYIHVCPARHTQKTRAGPLPHGIIAKFIYHRWFGRAEDSITGHWKSISFKGGWCEISDSCHVSGVLGVLKKVKLKAK